MTDCDVAIIGAGPYGLSAAAHLRANVGSRILVFGEPMSFWERHMPVGMLLRSPWAGSHLSDPSGSLTLDAYRQAIGEGFPKLIPLDRFIDYGRWFQKQVAPDVDLRQVTLIEAASSGFRLTLADGSKLETRRVVVAAGIGAFAWRPVPFRDIPSSLASHSSEHHDLSRFAGKQVLVIGAGQSALESAALVHEAGADVEVVVRGPQIHFLWQRPWLHNWPVEAILYAPPDVGPALASHLVARPNLFRRLPREWQDRLGSRSVRPAGAGWLKPRLADVPIITGRYAVHAEPADGRLRLRLDDGSEKTVDHALLGTGYRVDIRKHTFLSHQLLDSIRKANGYPQLNEIFESSVPGLHFVGAPAAWSFGPLMRFVAGADFTSRCLVRGIAREHRHRWLSDKKTGRDSRHSSFGYGVSRAVLKTENDSPTEAEVTWTHPGPSGPPGALLSGADYRALGVARSLGRRGIPVWVLRKPDHSLAAFSRFAQRTFTWPTGNGGDHVAFLLKLAAVHDLKGWVLIPTDDEAVGFISRHHETLAARFRLTIPPWKILRWACNKRMLYELAGRLQLDHPWTVCPRSRAEVESLDCSFPVIIKPALHDSFVPCLSPIYRLSTGDNVKPAQWGTINNLTADKAWRFEDRPSLLAGYDAACALLPPEFIMIQDLVPGWGEAQFSYAALCRQGQPLASLVARRTRQFPMDFGRFSTYVETLEEPRVAQAAARLLQALNYTGVVEVEFKHDPRDGRFKLLDVNPRVWGWHTLGARAGVDFSYLMWRFLQGEPVAKAVGRPGVGWMRLAADVPMAIQEVLRGRLSVREYLRSLRGPVESAIFAADDPLPGLLELPLLTRLLFRRLLPPSSRSR